MSIDIALKRKLIEWPILEKRKMKIHRDPQRPRGAYSMQDIVDTAEGSGLSVDGARFYAGLMSRHGGPPLILAQIRCDDVTYPFAAASSFMGTWTDSAFAVEIDVFSLNGARLTGDGTITSPCGRKLRSLIARPLRQHTERTFHSLIVEASLKVSGRWEGCLYRVRDHIADAMGVPDVQGPDYSKLPGLAVKSAKKIQRFLEQEHNIHVTRQTVSRALRGAGMRLGPS